MEGTVALSLFQVPCTASWTEPPRSVGSQLFLSRISPQLPGPGATDDGRPCSLGNGSQPQESGA